MFQSAGRAPPRWKLVPTRREQEKWHRAAKAATGGSVSVIFDSHMSAVCVSFASELYVQLLGSV